MENLTSCHLLVSIEPVDLLFKHPRMKRLLTQFVVGLCQIYEISIKLNYQLYYSQCYNYLMLFDSLLEFDKRYTTSIKTDKFGFANSSQNMNKPQMSRLEELKLNNPFEKITSSPKMQCVYQQKPINYKPSRPINQMQNPFYRKTLVKNDYQMDYLFDYSNYFPKKDDPVQRPSDASFRITNQSLKFVPTASGHKIDIQDGRLHKQAPKNRMAGQYNNYQGLLPQQQTQSKLFADILVPQSKQKYSQRISQGSKAKIIAQSIVSQGMNQMQLNPKQVQVQKSMSLNFRKHDSGRQQRESGNEYRMSKISQLSSKSPVNSLIDQKNQISYYQQIVKVEGKEYYRLPIINRNQRHF